jgi:large subunit ribosomal protein L22
MEFRAILRYAPMSGRKARPVVDLVRGQKVNDALETLTFIPKRAAPMLAKLIKSAVANAGQEGGVEASELVVTRARVNDGPLKQGRMRWRPAPMGRAQPIRKRTCHIEVVLEAASGAKKPGPRRRRDEATTEPAVTAGEGEE